MLRIGFVVGCQSFVVVVVVVVVVEMFSILFGLQVHASGNQVRIAQLLQEPRRASHAHCLPPVLLSLVPHTRICRVRSPVRTVRLRMAPFSTPLKRIETMLSWQMPSYSDSRRTP